MLDRLLRLDIALRVTAEREWKFHSPLPRSFHILGKHKYDCKDQQELSGSHIEASFRGQINWNVEVHNGLLVLF